MGNTRRSLWKGFPRGRYSQLTMNRERFRKSAASMSDRILYTHADTVSECSMMPMFSLSRLVFVTGIGCPVMSRTASGLWGLLPRSFNSDCSVLRRYDNTAWPCLPLRKLRTHRQHRTCDVGGTRTLEHSAVVRAIGEAKKRASCMRATTVGRTICNPMRGTKPCGCCAIV